MAGFTLDDALASGFKKIKIEFIYLFCMGTCVTVCTWRSEDYLEESVLYFHHASSGIQT